MLEQLTQIFTNLISQLGYPGIAIASFLETIFPPIPSEIIMGFGGYLVSQGRFNFFLTVLSAVIGNIASVSIVYYLGYKYGETFVSKYGNRLGVSPQTYQKGINLFKKYGYWSVFFSQLVPLARSWVGLPAATLKANYFKFILVNTLGVSIWMSVLCYVGYTLGKNWKDIKNVFGNFENLGYFVLFLILASVIYLIYRGRKNLVLSQGN